MFEWILGLPFIRCLVTLPLDEPAADRVVLQFVDGLVAREELCRHRIRMVEVSFGGVKDNVFQTQVERLGTYGHFVSLVGIGCQPVEKFWRTGSRSFPQQSRQ